MTSLVLLALIFDRRLQLLLESQGLRSRLVVIDIVFDELGGLAGQFVIATRIVLIRGHVNLILIVVQVIDRRGKMVGHLLQQGIDLIDGLLLPRRAFRTQITELRG